MKLPRQPFQVLALLVARHGELVTREELHAAIWSDGTTVEFDQGLNFCIRQIRVALGDEARRPAYIETVPKQGYRFVAAVGSGSNSSAPPQAEARKGRGRIVAGVGAALVAAVAAMVVVVVRHQQPSQESPEVHRLLLEADYLAGTWESGKVRQAADRYREVIRRAPALGDAWSGLANAEVVLVNMQPSAGTLPQAEDDARHALGLAGSRGRASAALGQIYWQEWRWREADAAFVQALAAEADAPDTLQLDSLYLASVGRGDEAIARARRAVDLLPTSGLMNYSLAQVYLHTGRTSEALAQARRTLLVDRDFPLAFRTVLRASAQLGRADEALAVLADQRRLFPDRPSDAWQPYVLAHLGRTDVARRLIASMPPGQQLSLGYAAALAELGNADAAFEVLDRAVSTRAMSVIWLKVTPELAPLHTDPRFAALLQRMGC